MKYAKSLLYCDLTIDAEEADYTDSERLILQCLNCGAPVFWVGGSTRGSHDRLLRTGKTVRVGKATVKPHFSHFQGVDAEDCERRISRWGSKELKMQAGVFRGQALFKLWKRFYTVMGFHLVQGLAVDEMEAFFQEINRTDPVNFMLYQKNIQEATELLRVRLKQTSLETIIAAGNIRKHRALEEEQWRNKHADGFKYLKDYNLAARNFSILDARVSWEACQFLSQKNNLPLLKGLITRGFVCFVVSFQTGAIPPQESRGIIFQDSFGIHVNSEAILRILPEQVFFEIITTPFILNLKKLEEQNEPRK